MSAVPEELEQLLAETKQKSYAEAPPEALATMKKAGEEMAAAWAAEKSLQEGQKAPDFTLPSVRNVGGEQFQLAAQLARGPVVLAFYRGGW